MIKFDNPTIDLVRTYDEFEKNSISKKPWRHTFGFPIVNLAIGVISGWPYEEDILGIRKCLEYEVTRLKKKDYFWIFPVGYTDLGDEIKIYKNQMLLVDSLVFSVIEFNEHLHEHSTGMSEIVRLKLRRGFELACIWGAEGALLKPDKNDWIVTRNNEKWLKYISNEHQRMYGRSE